jgi:hypothetical protein
VSPEFRPDGVYATLEERRDEDVIWRQGLTIERLNGYIERLVDEVERWQPRGSWVSATEKRSAIAAAKRIEARSLRAGGWSVPRICRRIGRTQRTVEGYLRGPD